MTGKPDKLLAFTQNPINLLKTSRPIFRALQAQHTLENLRLQVGLDN